MAYPCYRIFSWGAFAGGGGGGGFDSSGGSGGGGELVGFVTARVVKLHECDTHVSAVQRQLAVQCKSACLDRLLPLRDTVCIKSSGASAVTL